MNDFKILIDTNVIIGLEDFQPVQDSFAELGRLSNEHAVGLFVDHANYDDVSRDKDNARRVVTLSKLAKFPKLKDITAPEDDELAARFGSINSDNDRADVRLLAALDAKAVDFLVSQDIGVHRRASRAGLGANVFTVDDALVWLKQTFTTVSVTLPYMVERKAYQIDPDDPIFASVRADYPEFDKWFDNCRRQHRECWVLEVDDKIAGLVIRKTEKHRDSGTQHCGPKILKICTFKVGDDFHGEKFGELLLKQVLWFAQSNFYDLVYLTAFPKQAFLIDLLSYYGFRETKHMANGELMLEKPILTGPIVVFAENVLQFDQIHYPRFYDGENVRKFCVPIQPNYHRRLFPEIAYGSELPLFPKETFGLMLPQGEERASGNTIRKVYLCRARSQRLRPGDILAFYVSKDESYAASQSISTIGIVEQVADVRSTEDLIRRTAKRSVFNAESLLAMTPSVMSPVKTIDFLLIGHLAPVAPLKALLEKGVFRNRPPQSIAEWHEEQYAALRPLIQLGFEI